MSSDPSETLTSTSEQDKYGNSETRLKNASIRGTDPFDYVKNAQVANI
jgi:hypothetical protein